MPSIEWQHNDTYRRVDSSDPTVVARWLLERVTEASPAHPNDYTTVRITPMYVRNPMIGKDEPDWPGTRVAENVSSEQARKRLAAYIMAWQAEMAKGVVKIDE